MSTISVMTKFGFLLVGLLLLVPTRARAALYSVDFCAKYGIDYNDASSGAGDDWFTTNTARVANGAKIRVRQLPAGPDKFFDYTDDSGANAGCTSSLVLNSNYDYRVSVQSTAQVSGNTISVLNNDTDHDLYSYIAYMFYSPRHSTNETFTTSLADQWNIAAAAGWAMRRGFYPETGKTFLFYTQHCPFLAGGSCENDEWLYIDSSTPGAGEKYVITHEMGHAAAEKANGGDNEFKDYSADTGGCYTSGNGGHGMNQEEYQSAAVTEGIAHYFAAITFNDPSEFDCFFVYYKSVDWDLDGTDDSPAVASVTCQGGPMYPIDQYDYLGDMCDPPLDNRATEYDWLRFFWDLTYDQEVSPSTIYDIWDDADPNDWCRNDTVDDMDTGTTDPPCSSGDFPADRLRDAAHSNGVLTEWDNEDYRNGVYR